MYTHREWQYIFEKKIYSHLVKLYRQHIDKSAMLQIYFFGFFSSNSLDRAGVVLARGYESSEQVTPRLGWDDSSVGRVGGGMLAR